MGGWNWYLPWMIRVSGKFRPAALTRIFTPLPFTSGLAISSMTRFSAGPYSLHRMAFMIAPGLSVLTLIASGRVCFDVVIDPDQAKPTGPAKQIKAAYSWQ